MLGHLLELLMKLDGTAWCNHLKALQGPTTPSVAMKRGYYMRLQTSPKIHKKIFKAKEVSGGWASKNLGLSSNRDFAVKKQRWKKNTSTVHPLQYC